jgi:uncharacterized hydrophobic protein (TIGR00271 family)
MSDLGEVDIQRMRDQLFFEGPERGRRLSRYWLLLPLAAVIASAGVVSDSTATVIGAMIVAPLMTPILGIVLAVVLADGANLRRCVLLVVAGAAAVVAIGWLLGLFVPYPVVAATNSQVAARVTPRIVDLVAALATGAVGSVALARSDISDTLPGVAIAISLVPPLAVVGLTLESGAPHQSLAPCCCSSLTSPPSWPAASWSWPSTGSTGSSAPWAPATAAPSPSSPPCCSW